ncbi:hypothetical protein L484_026929 [Morus notabilis]|uniref:Organ-specific protein S2 n=1 Tax=Morus notabilis TaxID=981085 RepID=W9R0Z1_9ROSA|nr:organ-specific protein P4 [Morus notabilis]EXB63590.1 hypothetical protein L484_026929 [Morus notabilis]
MKSIFAFFVLFSILLVGNISYARKDAGEYWNSIMKDQPIPEAIRDLFYDQDLPSDLTGPTKHDRFVRDFDVQPNVIIYHSHAQPQGEDNHKPSVHNHHHEELEETH